MKYKPTTLITAFNPIDVADRDLHELMEGTDPYDSAADSVARQQAVDLQDDEAQAAGIEGGRHIDERVGESGQAEGFEGSEELLIRAAEGQYQPPSDASRDGENRETLDADVSYGEADSEHPQDTQRDRLER